jgi:DNA-directed RNA polymerase specialized sigma24 family protein
MAEPGEFDGAVAALVGSLAEGEEGAPFSDDQLEVILQGLGRFVRSRFPTLGREEVVDSVNEALARFIDAVRQDRVDVGSRPAAYLTKTTENISIDAVRERETPVDEEVLDELSGEDTSFESFLNVLSERTTILKLMRQARDTGQHELNELIRCWMDVDASGEKPTLRKVGARLGISHTEVRRRLDRLADLDD